MRGCIAAGTVIHALLLFANNDRRCPSPTAVAINKQLDACATPPPGVMLRVAEPHELELVAQLQLDIFAPPDDPPPLLPMLQSLFEANERAARRGMRRRLTDELITRVEKGSEIIVALEAEEEGAAEGGVVDAGGLYSEPGKPLLGAVDISCAATDSNARDVE